MKSGNTVLGIFGGGGGLLHGYLKLSFISS